MSEAGRCPPSSNTNGRSDESLVGLNPKAALRHFNQAGVFDAAEDLRLVAGAVAE
jgi:hypothetical protein